VDEIERLEAELALAKKSKELRDAKEGGSIEDIKRLKAEVNDLRVPSREARAGSPPVVTEDKVEVRTDAVASKAAVPAPGGNG
jgi:uncharacterized small protein (DUF1192 family)